jgi:RIO-like serine/threonine protein kinase
MDALGRAGFPVPRAIDHSRHAVLMSLVEGAPLVQVRVSHACTLKTRTPTLCTESRAHRPCAG